VEHDGGTHNLSHTDLAFYQTFCETESNALPHRQVAGLDRDGGIDESAHIEEDTLFGDPNAGRPDDPDDANPSSPYGREVTRSAGGTPKPAK
jgi:hypothetical protein